jgi:hypothetical protein
MFTQIAYICYSSLLIPKNVHVEKMPCNVSRETVVMYIIVFIGFIALTHIKYTLPK